MDIFPNITHLTLVQEDEDVDNANLDQLIRLIQHYSNRLISLKLDLAYGDKDDKYEQASPAFEPHVVALFDSINRLESLQHLTLNVSFPPFMRFAGKLSNLSRLTTFTSHKFRPTHYLSPWLSELVDGNVLLDCEIDDMDFEELSELNPRVLAKFAGLSIGEYEYQNMLCLKDFNRFHLLCSRLTSITTLKLIARRMPMTMLARCLAQLPGLIHLKVNFHTQCNYFSLGKYFRIPEEGDDKKSKKEDEEKEGEKEDKTKLVIAPLPIVPLPSVRLLTLALTTKSHHDTERLHLHEIFPNLQVLNFYQEPNKCDECGFNRYRNSRKFTKISNCMRLSRRPFLRCAQLHTIKLETKMQYRRCIPRDLITRDQL